MKPINELALTVTEIVPMLKAVMGADLVPFVKGSPGIGKSSIGNQIAKDINYKMIDVRLSQSDPTDLNGFPFPNRETGKGEYLPMDTFPVLGDDLPDKYDDEGKVIGKYDGWFIFLDEFNSAPLMVQAAAYKLVLDRMVGQHKLHSSTVLMCAGNLETDGAITNRMSTAMQSRLVHLELKTSLPCWLKWAYDFGIDHRITSFLEFRPEKLNSFDPNHSDVTFPCERTWEFMSRIIKDEDVNFGLMPLYAGTIGKGVAADFLTFVKIYKDLTSFSEIIRNPKGVDVPTAPGTLYALAGLVGESVTESTIEKAFVFLERLPIEFQVITMRRIFGKKTVTINNPELAK